MSPANRAVQFAFGSAIAGLLVAGAFSYRSIVFSGASEGWIRHTHDVIETLQDLTLAVAGVESSTRGFALTGLESYIDSADAAIVGVGRDEATLRKLTADNPVQQRNLPGLEKLAASKIQYARALLDLPTSRGLPVAVEDSRNEAGQKLTDEFEAAVGELRGEELRLLSLREAAAARNLDQSKDILAAGILIALLVTTAAFWNVLRDNSRRWRAEVALQESERKYWMLVDGVKGYAILMLGPHGEIRSWNPGAERMSGYTFEQVSGRSYSCFFLPEDVKRGRPEEILRLATASDEYEEQGIRVRKDGTRFLMRTAYTVSRDSAGTVRGFSVIGRDLTESTESGAKYRGLMEAAPDAMVVVNQGGEIVLLNVQAEKQFGYRRDELLGQRVTNIIPEGFAERLIADDLRSSEDALAQQIGTGIELNARRKDGSEFPIEIMLSPLESAEGVLVTAAIRDISVRRAVDEHLGRMEGRYRGLLEAAPDPMVVVNQGGEIVLLNVQAEKQFGYRRDELIGQKVTNIIPEGFAERLIADALRSTEDALAQQIGTGIELTGRRKDGDEFPIEIMLSPLESPEGILVTAAVRDISLRKQMERLKDEFVSTVSHELRTPLTSISGSLGLLVGQWAGKLPESAARLLTIAHTNSQRLVRLINDILDIEKIEFGRVVFKLGRIDVVTLVEQVIEGNRGFAEGYDVRVRLETASDDAEVNADPDRLAQVITNLLSNAIKFSPVDGEVLVTIQKHGDAVRISVRDHGGGIPTDFKRRIFQKFAQADATSTRQKGGTGLGLSIAKQIVERLDGKMSFDDAPGGGTIFHVELPAWDGRPEWDTDTGAVTGAARILLCEDDRPAAIVLRERLRLAGYATDFAHTANVAIDRATAVDYAAFLVDLQLPDGDGIDLMIRLRRQSRYRSTPIVVISGHPARGRDDNRSSGLNVLDWLSKPIDFEHLIGVIRTSILADPGRRPRILHVDDDHQILAAVTDILKATADVVSADSLTVARRELATNLIDLAVLDISVGSESGLDLLPSLHDRGGDLIPVIVFSANVEGQACDEQVKATLAKSSTSLENLLATVRDRLSLVPPTPTKEVA
jgi:PAS domain S-box-containing protein